MAGCGGAQPSVRLRCFCGDREESIIFDRRGGLRELADLLAAAFGVAPRDQTLVLFPGAEEPPDGAPQPQFAVLCEEHLAAALEAAGECSRLLLLDGSSGFVSPRLPPDCPPEWRCELPDAPERRCEPPDAPPPLLPPCEDVGREEALGCWPSDSEGVVSEAGDGARIDPEPDRRACRRYRSGQRRRRIKRQRTVRARRGASAPAARGPRAPPGGFVCPGVFSAKDDNMALHEALSAMFERLQAHQRLQAQLMGGEIGNAAELDMQWEIDGMVRNDQQYVQLPLQVQCIEVVPLWRIAAEAREMDRSEPFQLRLLRALAKWYKRAFFQWTMDIPCDECGGEAKSIGVDSPTNEELRFKASRVEIWECKKSPGHLTRFPRYNDPAKLLVTRRGRCGEFHNLFAAICTALGFDTRHCHAFFDHVWLEVWMPGRPEAGPDAATRGRWLHVDAEDIGKPTLYAGWGWGSKINWIIGVSGDGCVADVTRRYTQKWDEVLQRRTSVDEGVLRRIIARFNCAAAMKMSAERRAVRALQAAAEQAELWPAAAAAAAAGPSPAEAEGRPTEDGEAPAAPSPEEDHLDESG